jgi:hypothetical protein
MPILAIGAGISGAGSILGGLFGGKGASQAGQLLQNTGKQAGAAMGTATTNAVNGVNAATTAGQGTIGTAVGNANNTLQGIYNPLQSNLNPYMQAGQQGVAGLTAATAPGGSLSQQFAFNPNQLYQDPSYQFNLQQGQQAIQRSAAASGGALGAGTQKALAQYTSGLASNEYQNAYNRALTSFQTNRQDTMQNLTALLGTGQFGTQQSNQLGTSFGGMMSGNTMQGGLAQANLGLQGAQIGGQFGLQGTQAGQNFLMQGAQGGAAGIVGSTNAYNSILPGLANAAQGYGIGQMYSNMMSGGPMNSQAQMGGGMPNYYGNSANTLNNYGGSGTDSLYNSLMPGMSASPVAPAYNPGVLS